MTVTDSLSARCVRITSENPEQALDLAEAKFSVSDFDQQLLAVDFDFVEYWRDEKPLESLTVFYFLQRRENRIIISATILKRAEFSAAHWSVLQNSAQSISAWLQSLGSPSFRLDQAIALHPIAIPKPWGQEIWYTGIERRGVAQVRDGERTMPLPWLLAVAPRHLTGNVLQPILLKILDPLPDVVFGDLYFELHRQKQEVYVVTAVDRSAWPDGKGAIRFGFNADKRARYRDDRQFLADYLRAVGDYRAVRKTIDDLLDSKRAQDGVGLNDPVSATTLQAWLGTIPASLREQEQALRAAMEEFTGMQALTVGDVVKVPCFVPHSLQHGVRTVEFQTPVYERMILSFAQKVLTQSNWDTDAAAALLRLDPPPAEPLQIVAQGAGWVEERIVEFDDFEVRRVALQAGASYPLALPRDQYALCMAIGGDLVVANASLKADAALLLPVGWVGGIANPGHSAAYLLLARPRG